MRVILPKVWEADVHSSQACSSSGSCRSLLASLPSRPGVCWALRHQLLQQVTLVFKAVHLELVRDLYRLEAIFVFWFFQLVFALPTSCPSFLLNCLACWLQAPASDTEATTSHKLFKSKPLFCSRHNGSASLDPTVSGTQERCLQSQRNAKLPSSPITSLPPASLGDTDEE